MRESLDGKVKKERQYLLAEGLELLQMVLELDPGRCASEEVKPRRGWIQGGMPAKTLDPKRWIGGSHIDRRREQVPTRMLAPRER